MAEHDVALDPRLREQVVRTMSDLLVRMLRRDAPVTEDTKLMAELGLSSSMAAQLVLDLEQDLSIMIDVEDLDQEETVTLGDMADYIVTHSTPQ